MAEHSQLDLERFLDEIGAIDPGNEADGVKRTLRDVLCNLLSNRQRTLERDPSLATPPEGGWVAQYLRHNGDTLVVVSRAVFVGEREAALEALTRHGAVVPMPTNVVADPVACIRVDAIRRAVSNRY